MAAPSRQAAGHWFEAAATIWHNMAMARRQTLIQLDDARLAALDERAATSGRSRSDLVREAIDLLLGTGDAAAIDAAIVEGYERVPASELDPWALPGAVEAIRAEPW
jgi:Arc/MetJ-type ribon-helix-helix transcriptional regulator